MLNQKPLKAFWLSLNTYNQNETSIDSPAFMNWVSNIFFFLYKNLNSTLFTIVSTNIKKWKSTQLFKQTERLKEPTVRLEKEAFQEIKKSTNSSKAYDCDSLKRLKLEFKLEK